MNEIENSDVSSLNANANIFSRMMSKASQEKKRKKKKIEKIEESTVKKTQSKTKRKKVDKTSVKKSQTTPEGERTTKTIKVRIAKTKSSKKVLSKAKQPVIAIVQESKTKKKRKNSPTSVPLPHPALLRAAQKSAATNQPLKKQKTKEKTSQKKKKRKSTTTTTTTKKKKLKPNSEEWILKQNPFFLSAEQRERRASILKKRKEEKKQSAVKRLREKEKEIQKQDKVLKETFGRVDNPFFANVGSAIRRQAEKKKMKSLTVDLTDSNADSNRKWHLSLFPEDSSLIQLPPHLHSNDASLPPFITHHHTKTSSPVIMKDIDMSLRKILCPNNNDDDNDETSTTPFVASSVSTLTSQIKSTFFKEQQQQEDTDLDMEIETLTTTLLQTAKRLCDRKNHVHSIWTRKYVSENKPSDLLGSVTSKITTQMCEWLELWQKRFTEERRLERKRLKNRLRQCFFLDRNDEEYIDAACNKRVSTGYLLEGPVGSGKTVLVRIYVSSLYHIIFHFTTQNSNTQVHACAKAANAKVIEIHSGSRRSRRDILKMIGEATQSKRLAMNGESRIDQKKSQNQSKKKKRKIVDDDDDDDEEEKDNNVEEDVEAQMTIILFEDVDVVLESDAGFLSAIRKVLQNAKCPVVMTCSRVPHELRRVSIEDPRALKIRSAKRPMRWKSTLWLKSICEVEGLSVSISVLDRLLVHYDFNLAKSLHCLQWMKDRVRYFESKRDVELSALNLSVSRLTTPSSSSSSSSSSDHVNCKRCRPEVVAVEPEFGPLEGGTSVEISLRLVDATENDCKYLTSSPVRVLIANEECSNVRISEWDLDAKPEPAITIQAVTPTNVNVSHANWPQNVLVIFASGRCRTDELVRHNAMFTFECEKEEDVNDMTEDIDTSLLDVSQRDNDDGDEVVLETSTESVEVKMSEEESIEPSSSQSVEVKMDVVEPISVLNVQENMSTTTQKMMDTRTHKKMNTTTQPRKSIKIDSSLVEKKLKPLQDLTSSCELMCDADMITLYGFQFKERHHFESKDAAYAVLCRDRGRDMCEALTKLSLGGEDRDFTLRTSQQSRWSSYDRILGHANGGIRDYPCHNLLQSLHVRTNVATEIMPCLRRICTLQEEKIRLEALAEEHNNNSSRRRLRRRRNSGPVHYLDLPNVGVYLKDSQKKWLISTSTVIM